MAKKIEADKAQEKKVETKKVKEVKKNTEKKTKKVVKLKGNEMIVVVINRGYSDFVVDAARDAGATGVTIMTGKSENKEKCGEIAGIKFATEKEIVLIVVPKSIRKKVMKEISARTHLQEKGNGICFSVPVNDVRGLIEFDELV